MSIAQKSANGSSERLKGTGTIPCLYFSVLLIKTRKPSILFFFRVLHIGIAKRFESVTPNLFERVLEKCGSYLNSNN